MTLTTLDRKIIERNIERMGSDRTESKMAFWENGETERMDASLMVLYTVHPVIDRSDRLINLSVPS